MLVANMTGIQMNVTSKAERGQVKFALQNVQVLDTYTTSPVFPNIVSRSRPDSTEPMLLVSIVRDSFKGRKIRISSQPLDINVNLPYLKQLVDECKVAKPAKSAIQNQLQQKEWLSQVSPYAGTSVCARDGEVAVCTICNLS